MGREWKTESVQSDPAARAGLLAILALAHA